MWREIGLALGLMLVLEGLLPFVNPEAFRKALAMLTQWDGATLRFAGLTSMIIGLLLLYILR
jgi:uncharacterized protein YjeT (DUF2065 family)